MSGAQPPPRRAVTIVERFVEAARARDLERARAYLSSDITVDEPPGLPYGGTYRGHDEYATLHQRMAACWEELTPSEHSPVVTDAGDVVLVQGAVHGVLKGRASTVAVPVIERYRVENDLIVSIEAFYFDEALGQRAAASADSGPPQDSGKFGQFAMSRAELDEFLSTAQQAIVGSLRRSGAPFLIPCGFAFDGTRFYVTFGRDRGVVQRLRRDRRVSLTVPSTHAYPTKFVIVEGLAEEVSDPRHELSRMVLFRGPADKWSDRNVDPEQFFQSWISVGRVVFAIQVTNLITFDGSKTPKHEKYGVGTRMPTDPDPQRTSQSDEGRHGEH